MPRLVAALLGVTTAFVPVRALSGQITDFGPTQAQVKAAYELSLREGWSQVRTRWLKALDAGDAKQLREVYERDATLVRSNGQVVAGRDGIVAWLLAERRRLAGWTLDIDGLSGAGTVAVIRGTASVEVPRENAPPVHVEKPFVVGLREVSRGSWRIFLQEGGDAPAQLTLGDLPGCTPAPGDTLTLTARLTAGPGEPFEHGVVVFEHLQGPAMVIDGDALALTDERGTASARIIAGPTAGAVRLRVTHAAVPEAPQFVELDVAETGTCALRR